MELGTPYPKYQVSIFCGNKWAKNGQLVIRSDSEEDILNTLQSPKLAILCGCVKKLDETVNPVAEQTLTEVGTQSAPAVAYPKCEHEQIRGKANSIAEAKEKLLEVYPDLEFKDFVDSYKNEAVKVTCKKCKATTYINTSREAGKFVMAKNWS